MPILVTLVAGIFITFVVVYLVRSIHDALTPSIATEVVQEGNMDGQRSVVGMIIRYEDVVYAPRSGRVSWAVNEMDRVRGNALVAGIQDAAISDRSQDIQDVEDEIKRLHELRHHAESDAVVQRFNNNIINALNSSAHNFTALNISEIHKLHDRLSQQIDNRNQVILSDGIGAVGEAGRDLIRLREFQNANSTNVYAPSSGIMFSVLDGHETLVTPSNMRELERQEIGRVVDHNDIVPIRDVEEGDPIFKLVGNIWYIVVDMPTDMAQGFVYNTDRTIFLHNDILGEYVPMVMRVRHIEHRHTDSRIIFRSNRNVMDFLNQRNVSIRTTDYISRGLKVSNSAIVERRFIRIPTTHVHAHGGNYFVHMRTAYGLQHEYLEVQDRTDGFVYVLEETLGLIMGDSLMPTNVMDANFTITESAVRVVHGLYRANFGYASFVTVHLDEPLSDLDSHTLLNPVRNPHLRQFDTIVTDATTVSQGDIIR